MTFEETIDPRFEGIANRKTKGITLESNEYEVEFKVKYQTKKG